MPGIDEHHSAGDDAKKTPPPDFAKSQEEQQKRGDGVQEVNEKGQKTADFQGERSSMPSTVTAANTEASSYGRQSRSMEAGVPVNKTFGVEGQNAITGTEFRAQNGRPMLLTADRQIYQGTLGPDGKSISTWQPIKDGQPHGDPLKVNAEKSGAPPPGVSADRYIEARKNANDSNNNANQNQLEQMRFGSNKEQPQTAQQRMEAAKHADANKADANKPEGKPGEHPNKVLEGKVSVQDGDGKTGHIPADLQKTLEAKDAQRAHAEAEGRGGKPHDGLPQHIDGKLLAQLQNLGRFPDLRDSFVDLISKFQESKLLHDGKDGGLLSILQGMKEGELGGLKAWLTDGKKNLFDFKGLDIETQRGISQVFDTLLGRGQEKTTSAMLDARGMRENLQDSSALISRSLAGERGQTDFRLNTRELDPVLQGILGRLQGKEFEIAKDDRTISSRIDASLDDAKQAARLSEAAKEALIRHGEVTRGLGPRETQALVDEIKTKALDSKEEAARKLEEIKGPEKGQDLSAEQVKLMLAEQKELEAAKQKKLDEQAEQERQEKEKQDEKKKQADEERLYIVMPNDTLNSISKKFFHKTDHAEIIYDRNLENIMLQDYKDQPYAKLYPRQRIIIPNLDYIEKFKSSTKSHKHISFDKIPYGTAAEELEQMFGKNWTGHAGAIGSSLTHKLPAGDEDNAPINRRSFSGNATPVSDAGRRANVHAALGLNTPTGQPVKYNVHLGESLRSIAQKFYKSPAYWRLLAIKNNLSAATDQRGNPLALLRRGQQLCLPEPCELESFLRHPESPVVVALSANERGLLLPRSRQCGYCKRATLAMAVTCLSCGQDMDSYVPGETALEEEHGSAANQPATILSAMQDVVEQVATLQLQDVTLTNKFMPMNFSPEHPQPAEAMLQAEHPHPPHDPHPLPHADLSRVEFSFEEADPIWTASPEPLALDQFVQIVETETLEGNVRGLIVTLQLLSQDQWLTLFDYHVFPEEVIIHKYQRKGGRRMMKKNMPAKQSKQMAWNHFRANWQAICREYWSS